MRYRLVGKTADTNMALGRNCLYMDCKLVTFVHGLQVGDIVHGLQVGDIVHGLQVGDIFTWTASW